MLCHMQRARESWRFSERGKSLLLGRRGLVVFGSPAAEKAKLRAAHAKFVGEYGAGVPLLEYDAHASGGTPAFTLLVA